MYIRVLALRFVSLVGGNHPYAYIHTRGTLPVSVTVAIAGATID